MTQIDKRRGPDPSNWIERALFFAIAATALLLTLTWTGVLIWGAIKAIRAL